MAIWSHHFMANRWENNGNSDRALFSWALKSLRMVTAAMKLKDAPWKKSYDKPKQHIKRLTKVHVVKAMVCPVVMYGYESWSIKKAEH